MASFSCHAFAGTKRFRVERIVRPQLLKGRAHYNINFSDNEFIAIVVAENMERFWEQADVTLSDSDLKTR